MIIDLHSHYFPLDAVRSGGMDVAVSDGADGSLIVRAADHKLDIDRDLVDLRAQHDALTRQRLDRRTLMPPPYTILYELEGDTGLHWARMLNDGTAAAQRSNPDVFVGFATVPLQSPSSAVDELHRAIGELGLQGVEILTNVDGNGIDDPAYEPFWGAAASLGVPVLIHPNNVAGGERMGAYYLRNLVGNPTETAQAGARILFAGVLERHPRLKIILSHGGGAMPHLIGRLRHGYEVRPECRERAANPIEQIRNLYYDTIVFDPLILRHLVEIVGVDRVAVGTDFPFDMGETNPIGFVETSGLSDRDCQTILQAGERLLSRS